MKVKYEIDIKPLVSEFPGSRLLKQMGSRRDDASFSPGLNLSDTLISPTSPYVLANPFPGKCQTAT